MKILVERRKPKVLHGSVVPDRAMFQDSRTCYPLIVRGFVREWGVQQTRSSMSDVALDAYQEKKR